jgi:hypothetical protein
LPDCYAVLSDGGLQSSQGHYATNQGSDSGIDRLLQVLDKLLQSETYASTQELKVGMDSLNMESINALSEFTHSYEGGVQNFGV